MTDVPRPRLLVIATTYPRWQGDHEPGFVHELARRLVDRFDVVAVVPHASGARNMELMDGVKVVRYKYAPERFETLVQDGGMTTHLRRSPWKWVLVPGFILMQWLTALRYAAAGTVVHAHWIILPGIVARLMGRPYVVTSHGADLFSLSGRLATTIKRWALAKASHVTVVSSAMLPLASALQNGRMPSVSPMGVDLAARFSPDSSVRRESDQLLFVGRLVEKKGIDVLLLALPMLLVKRPSLQLVIVGHGPMRDALVQMTISLGISAAVTFAGPVSANELPAYYRRASVFVAPFKVAASGDQEGLGLVLIEALGCGCPVVTTYVAAVDDVAACVPAITRVPSGNVELLAQGVLAVLGDANATRLINDARLQLCETFDWNHVAARYGESLQRASVGN